MCGVEQNDINYITKTFTSAKVAYCALHINCFRNCCMKIKINYLYCYRIFRCC